MESVPSGGLEDPVGPSMYDPVGVGHYGREKLAAFWDRVIDTIQSFHFVITDSFAAGNEVSGRRPRRGGFARAHAGGVFGVGGIADPALSPSYCQILWIKPSRCLGARRR